MSGLAVHNAMKKLNKLDKDLNAKLAVLNKIRLVCDQYLKDRGEKEKTILDLLASLNENSASNGRKDHGNGEVRVVRTNKPNDPLSKRVLDILRRNSSRDKKLGGTDIAKWLHSETAYSRTALTTLRKKVYNCLGRLKEDGFCRHSPFDGYWTE